MTVISVIVGSTRDGRFSEKPANWILGTRRSAKLRTAALREGSVVTAP